MVAAAWYVFARSLAEKTVTVAQPASESGEIRKISAGRQWALQLGTFPFASGIMTQQWALASVGLVYSLMTAAAMWENFRVRLPYLYDPWSEPATRAPSLLRAMVAVGALVEGGAVVFAIVYAALGKQWLGIAQPAVFGLAGLIVAGFVVNFLGKQGVRQRDLLLWPSAGSQPSLALSLLSGIGAGAALGGRALVYLWGLESLPAAAEALAKARAQAALIPHFRQSMAVLAIGVAPFTEEFLFRALLFRALDREWGFWRALIGSAAFFAIDHPFLSWPPVMALGLLNAWLFRRNGSLAPAIVAHMAYNAVVVGAPLFFGAP